MWYEMGNIGNFFGEWKSDDFPIKSMNFVKNILGIFIISISMHHKKKSTIHLNVMIFRYLQCHNPNCCLQWWTLQNASSKNLNGEHFSKANQ